MKVIPLNCNHCGAPLEVPAKARFVTCGFCEASLSVEHTGNSYSTAVLEEIKETTQKLARDVEQIKATTEIERLDSQWVQAREHHMVTGKHGNKSLPTKGMATVMGVVGVGFGLVWTVIAFSIVSGAQSFGAPGPVMLFPVFGVIFIGVALFTSISTFNKAEAYERDYEKYRQERRRLIRESQEG